MADGIDSLKDDRRGYLIDFLTEDLKETGEHLRDTDRKTHLTIQISGGAFVLLVTILAGLLQQNVIDLRILIGVPGLVALGMIAPATWWLFLYTLKSKETKQVYIHRMNFLRRMIHQYIGTPQCELTGYWTASQVRTGEATAPQEGLGLSSKSPRRIGLDDLYPMALQVLFVAVAALLGLLICSLICDGGPQPVPGPFASVTFLLPWAGMVAFAVLALGLIVRQRQTCENSIREQVGRYADPRVPTPSLGHAGPGESGN